MHNRLFNYVFDADSSDMIIMEMYVPDDMLEKWQL